jgi:hypothetical protein
MGRGQGPGYERQADAYQSRRAAGSGILHEIDHLDGVLFVDRVESPDKLWQAKPEDLQGERGAELEKSPVPEMA